MGIVPEAITFLVELMAAEIMFTVGLPKRPNWKKCAVGCVALLVLFSVLWPVGWSGHIKTVKYLLIFLGTVAGGYLLFEISWWESLYRCAAAYATQHIAFHVGNIVSGGPLVPESASLTVFSAYLAVYAAVYFLSARRIRKEGAYGVNNRFLILFVLIMLLMVVFLNYWCIGIIYGNAKLYVILAGYSIIGCVFALFIQSGLAQQAHLEQKLMLTEQMLHNRREQFKISEETIECINIKCHDLKHQISMLRNRIDDPSCQKALQEVESAVLIYDSVVKTGNEALDIILTEKSLLCEKKKIQLTCIVDGSGFSEIQDADLYSIFGNILDNAIESVAELKDVDKRAIGLSVKNTGSMMVIHTENYFAHVIKWENGLPCTTKEDKRFHGYGMRSVQILVERYAGTMTIDVDEDIFNLNIMIPLNAHEKGFHDGRL